MASMNISLTAELKHAVDEQVARRGYVSTSEYVRDLIRRDVEFSHVRDLLLEGAESEPLVVDDDFWSSLHEGLDRHAGG